MPPIFAAETLPVSATPLFTVLGLPVTNSMFTGVTVGLLVALLFVLIARRSQLQPRSKFVYFMETVTDFILGIIAANFGDDTKKARKFAGLFIAFFVFILINNLSGLLPGIGGSLYAVTGGGLKATLFRAFTTDLNGTLALATVTMATVQFYAIRARGGWGYIAHFFHVAEPWWNPMNIFLGPIEIISEATRVVTLALRLFGVIYAGDVLVDVIAQLSGNFAWIGTVPVVLMEIFFASLQAYLFIMLSSVYLQIGTGQGGSHGPEHEAQGSTSSATAAT